jgi:hypothetical protein
MFVKAAVIGTALALVATACAAEVIEKDADHFVLRYSVGLETTPDDIYGAIGEVGQWWNGAHTYTGDARHLTLPLNVGACFCEAMPDGTNFEHGRVVEADPNLGVLLDAPLGPLKGDEGRLEHRLDRWKPRLGTGDDLCRARSGHWRLRRTGRRRHARPVRPSGPLYRVRAGRAETDPVALKQRAPAARALARREAPQTKAPRRSCA